MSNPSAHSEHYDAYASRFGMWLFLLTEFLLFGGLFIVYSTYRYLYTDAFHLAARELDVTMGTINSIVLLISSTTASIAIAYLHQGKYRISSNLILATMFLGIVFLVNKFLEWNVKIEHGLYPGSKTLAGFGFGDTLFFGLYFAMTGLHALHMIVGLVLWSVTYAFIKNGRTSMQRPALMVNSGLYWHLIDVVWIFLFVLFYLIT